MEWECTLFILVNSDNACRQRLCLVPKYNHCGICRQSNECFRLNLTNKHRTLVWEFGIVFRMLFFSKRAHSKLTTGHLATWIWLLIFKCSYSATNADRIMTFKHEIIRMWCDDETCFPPVTWLLFFPVGKGKSRNYSALHPTGPRHCWSISYRKCIGQI